MQYIRIIGLLYASFPADSLTIITYNSIYQKSTPEAHSLYRELLYPVNYTGKAHAIFLARQT